MDLNFRNFLPFINMQVDVILPGEKDRKIWTPAIVSAVEPHEDGATLTI
jgi:hypothetical protein